ncbi:MAG TPA: FkbM family methyltransferase [Candidatus Dormibacteraeota bacterium]|nr:FkbM family methyltransferase [Candidatus Dormibacteraeota bacterium]
MNFHGNRLVNRLVGRVVFQNPRVHCALLRLRARDEDVDIELNGTPLRINKRQELSLWRAYKNTRDTWWSRATDRIVNLSLILSPTDTFLDIGANVGYYAASIARLGDAYPSMRIYAFEAHPGTAQRLRQSVRDLRVTVFQVALSNRQGELEFTEGTSSFTFTVSGTRSDFQRPGATRVIQTRRLDSMGIIGDSIVMKMDVRGHDREVIEGASALFDAQRVKAVLSDCGDDPAILDYLVSKGFRLFDAHTLAPGPRQSVLAIRSSYLESSLPRLAQAFGSM